MEMNSLHGGGISYVREASPLFDSPLVVPLFKRGEENLERGKAPSLTYVPPSHNREMKSLHKGDRGIGC